MMRLIAKLVVVLMMFALSRNSVILGSAVKEKGRYVRKLRKQPISRNHFKNKKLSKLSNKVTFYLACTKEEEGNLKCSPVSRDVISENDIDENRNSLNANKRRTKYLKNNTKTAENISSQNNTQLRFSDFPMKVLQNNISYHANRNHSTNTLLNFFTNENVSKIAKNELTQLLISPSPSYKQKHYNIVPGNNTTLKMSKLPEEHISNPNHTYENNKTGLDLNVILHSVMTWRFVQKLIDSGEIDEKYRKKSDLSFNLSTLINRKKKTLSTILPFVSKSDTEDLDDFMTIDASNNTNNNLQKMAVDNHHILNEYIETAVFNHSTPLLGMVPGHVVTLFKDNVTLGMNADEHMSMERENAKSSKELISQEKTPAVMRTKSSITGHNHYGGLYKFEIGLRQFMPDLGTLAHDRGDVSKKINSRNRENTSIYRKDLRILPELNRWMKNNKKEGSLQDATNSSKRYTNVFDDIYTQAAQYHKRTKKFDKSKVDECSASDSILPSYFSEMQRRFGELTFNQQPKTAWLPLYLSKMQKRFKELTFSSSESVHRESFNLSQTMYLDSDSNFDAYRGAKIRQTNFPNTVGTGLTSSFVLKSSEEELNDEYKFKLVNKNFLSSSSILRTSIPPQTFDHTQVSLNASSKVDEIFHEFASVFEKLYGDIKDDFSQDETNLSEDELYDDGDDSYQSSHRLKLWNTKGVSKMLEQCESITDSSLSPKLLHGDEMFLIMKRNYVNFTNPALNGGFQKACQLKMNKLKHDSKSSMLMSPYTLNNFPYRNTAKTIVKTNIIKSLLQPTASWISTQSFINIIKKLKELGIYSLMKNPETIAYTKIGSTKNVLTSSKIVKSRDNLGFYAMNIKENMSALIASPAIKSLHTPTEMLGMLNKLSLYSRHSVTQNVMTFNNMIKNSKMVEHGSVIPSKLKASTSVIGSQDLCSKNFLLKMKLPPNVHQFTKLEIKRNLEFEIAKVYREYQQFLSSHVVWVDDINSIEGPQVMVDIELYFVSRHCGNLIPLQKAIFSNTIGPFVIKGVTYASLDDRIGAFTYGCQPPCANHKKCLPNCDKKCCEMNEPFTPMESITKKLAPKAPEKDRYDDMKDKLGNFIPTVVYCNKMCRWFCANTCNPICCPGPKMYG